jgi:hypothetical protein
MAKKEKAVSCSKCGLEFPDSMLSTKHQHKLFVWDNKILCKDCLLMMGGDLGQAESWVKYQSGLIDKKPQI